MWLKWAAGVLCHCVWRLFVEVQGFSVDFVHDVLVPFHGMGIGQVGIGGGRRSSAG